MKCSECDSPRFVRFRKSVSYRPGTSWWRRLLGFPAFRLLHTGDVLVCVRCGTHYDASAETFARIGGPAPQRKAEEPQDHKPRPARTNDDIPWSRE